MGVIGSTDYVGGRWTVITVGGSCAAGYWAAMSEQPTTADLPEHVRGLVWVGFRAEPVECDRGSRAGSGARAEHRSGKNQRLELEQRSVDNLFEIHEGRVTRLVVYLDVSRAVADLGLAE
jgi:hypothetical protein